MARHTKKQKFLTLLKRSKNYVGNSTHTQRLYRRFLKILKINNKCNRTDLFGYYKPRSLEYYLERGHTNEYAAAAVHRIQSRGRSFYGGDMSKIQQRVEKRANTFKAKSIEDIAKINKLKGKSYDPIYLANKHNISIDEAVERIADRKRRKVDSFMRFMQNRDPHDVASRPFISYSKASKIFFDKLVKACAHMNLQYFYGDKEYFLYCKQLKTIKYYDFYIPELKLFIEYNGTYFHPREKDNHFITVSESIQSDKLKFDLAADHGISVEYVWEKQDEDGRMLQLIQLIGEKYNNYIKGDRFI